MTWVIHFAGSKFRFQTDERHRRTDHTVAMSIYSPGLDEVRSDDAVARLRAERLPGGTRGL